MLVLADTDAQYLRRRAAEFAAMLDDRASVQFVAGLLKPLGKHK
jgi:hypothetical protein